MNRKMVAVLIVMSFFISTSSLSFADEGQDLNRDIKVIINGNEASLKVSPIVEEDSVFLPLKETFEALGCSVNYRYKDRYFEITHGVQRVTLKIGSNFVGGHTDKEYDYKLEKPVEVINYKTFVTSDVLTEIFDAIVSWDEDSNTLTIFFLPEVEVHFIDVGLGEVIFIKNLDYDILINGGGEGAGEIIIDRLKELGTDDIELLVVTSPSRHKIGGLDEIMSTFDIEKIMHIGIAIPTKEYKEFINAVNEEIDEGAEMYINQDLTIELGNWAKFEIFSGNKYGYTSLVSRLSYNYYSFVFMDNLNEGVMKIIEDNDMDPDILELDRLSSKEDLNEKFLNLVSPRHIIISPNSTHKQGLPSTETKIGLQGYDKKILGLWKSIGIDFSTNGKNFHSHVKYRQD